MAREPFAGWHTIFGVEGEHGTPYLTRVWVGRLRLHVFHRGDADPDCHDHPWDFWTFPLTAYVEEVVRPDRQARADGAAPPLPRFHRFRQVVPALRWSYRPAEHTHRVLGRYDRRAAEVLAAMPFGIGVLAPVPVKPGRIVTIVWLGRSRRKWGFLRNRAGQWCWTPWRDYVFGGGKHAPCEPGDA